MRWRGLSSTVVAMAALAAGLVACGGSDGSDDGTAAAGDQGTQARGGGPTGTVRFALEDMPSTWEPWNPGDLNVVRQTYETLVRRDRAGKITPQLATAWKQTAKKLTLTLRSGVVFHDGTPFDGAAVKANIEAFQKSASAAGEILSAIEDVATDGDEVTMKLSRPAPDLLAALAEQTFMVSPKALAAGTIKTDPVGTGPWRYDDGASVPGSRIVMTAFDRYWDPENVHLERIESMGIEEPAARLSAVQTGEIDVADLDRELVDQARSAGFEVVTAPLLAYQFVVLRRTGPLADPRVREALCDGIDAEAIAKLVPDGQSELTTQRFAEGEYGHDPGVPARSYDPGKAKRLLAEAGNPKLDLTMAVQAGNQERAEAVAGQLAKIGVKLELRAMPSSQYFDTWRTKYPVGLGNMSSQSTPFAYYDSFLSPDGSYNPAKVKDPRIEAAAKRALSAPDADAAEPAWRDVAKLIHGEAISCADMKIMENLVYDPKKVTGVKYHGDEVGWQAIRAVN